MAYILIDESNDGTNIALRRLEMPIYTLKAICTRILPSYLMHIFLQRARFRHLIVHGLIIQASELLLFFIHLLAQPRCEHQHPFLWQGSFNKTVDVAMLEP